MFEERYKTRLRHQQTTGMYRQPPEINRREGKYVIDRDRKLLSFASNDYLGLATSDEVRQKVADNFAKYGPSSSSSRLVAGNYAIINQAEKEYAAYFGYEDALFFPSGYQANVGVISTFFEKGDRICFDKHIHASTVKGIQLSGADFFGYKHNSMKHLEKRMERKHPGPSGVVTESLFSMDGDFLEIEHYKALKEKYGFLSVIDEAHAIGAVGEKGRGIARDVADVTVGTFGKTLGLFGAFVLMPRQFKNYLLNFSSPQIYTTTLPEAHAASAIDLLDIISRSDDKRTRLREVSLVMKNRLREESFTVNGDAHIIALEIGEEGKAATLSEKLYAKNILAFPARYPTVPLGKAIIRIGMTALHNDEDVETFVNGLKSSI